MLIQYMQFSDSVLVFSPNREERELLLDVLQYLEARSGDRQNLAVLTHFISKLEYELSTAPQ